MRRNKLSNFLLLGLVLLSACAKLPHIVPDLNRHSRVPIQIETVNGTLSIEKSKLMLRGLQGSARSLTAHQSSPNSNIYERHLAFEESIIDSPLTAGNEVLLLQDGPVTYESMLSAIAAAQDHINMETYIMNDDAVGREFSSALIAKQQQGVQVNLIRDSAGTFTTPASYFQAMKDQGINILEFNPVNPLAARKTWELNQRDHRKLLIVDGKMVFLGGINISAVYSGGSFGSSGRSRLSGGAVAKAPLSVAPTKSEGEIDAVASSDTEWRDTDIRLRGPVVAEFQKLFIATWEKQRGKALANKEYFPPLQNVGNQIVRAIGSAPEDPYSLIYATLLSAIMNAQSSVYLTNAYFVPDPQLLSVLKAAARRGVDVKLILPSETDSWLVFHAGRRYYSRLLRAGVKIYQRQGVILHSKTALIDGVWATVGSTNLDWRSFLHNQEVNAVVLGSEFGMQIKAMFDKDLAASEEITRVKWRKRGLGLRVKELYAQLWAYWL